MQVVFTVIREPVLANDENGRAVGRANGPGTSHAGPMRALLDARQRAGLPSNTIMGQGLVWRESAA